MSSKYKRPAKEAESIEPEKLKVRRGELINFMNFMSMDENFCLRVWNTVQNAHAKYKAAEEEAALRANAEERAAEKAKAEAVPEDIVFHLPNTPAEVEPFSFAHIESVVAEAEA